MSLSTFFKLVGKAYRFSVRRPMQRFNIYNRAQNYLGQDAKYFKPAPRRQLPDGVPKVKLIEAQSPEDNKRLLENSSHLKITKTIEIQKLPALEPGEPSPESAEQPQKEARPLPVCRNLPLQDQANIWKIDKVPPGRLSLDMVSEILLHKLGEDEQDWTPEKIAQEFKIKQDYAAYLISHLKHIRIIVSPRMAQLLDYVSRDNAQYQASKHLVYIVDNSMRSNVDKQFDGTFDPRDQLDEKVRKVLEPPALVTRVEHEGEKLSTQEVKPANRLIRKPKPLRLGDGSDP